MALKRVNRTSAGLSVPGGRRIQLEHMRAKHGRYDARSDCTAQGMRHYYLGTIHALSAGVPVRLMRWQYAPEIRNRLPVGDGNAWFELGTDDTLRRVGGPFV
jgi:hypothetical protein